jgi:hypothetical protein
MDGFSPRYNRLEKIRFRPFVSKRDVRAKIFSIKFKFAEFVL